MRCALILFVTTAISCGSAKPFVVVDPAPKTDAWATVALTIAGPEADDDKREACLTEAHRAHVALANAAPITATLWFSDEGTRLALTGGEVELGKMTRHALCRVALARALGVDKMVKVSKSEPVGCQEMGFVNAQDDAGFTIPGAYEGALASIQFAARALGANQVVLDVAQSVQYDFKLSGRAFRCAAQTAQSH